MNGHNESNNSVNDFGLRDNDVYDLLTKVPPGKVATYGDIAKALGRPNSSRAVGRILAKNPNPIIVPCHRVVKSNGQLGGYAYGEEKKKHLLENEGIQVEKSLVKNFKYSRFVFTK